MPGADTEVAVFRSVRPLLTADELVNVERLVGEFLQPSSAGQKLQAILEKKYNSTDNWVRADSQDCEDLSFCCSA